MCVCDAISVQLAPHRLDTVVCKSEVGRQTILGKLYLGIGNALFLFEEAGLVVDYLFGRRGDEDGITGGK